jgi:hypothetical protein
MITGSSTLATFVSKTVSDSDIRQSPWAMWQYLPWPPWVAPQEIETILSVSHLPRWPRQVNSVCRCHRHYCVTFANLNTAYSTTRRIIHLWLTRLEFRWVFADVIFDVITRFVDIESCWVMVSCVYWDRAQFWTKEDPKVFSGQVFNFKLASFADKQEGAEHKNTFSSRVEFLAQSVSGWQKHSSLLTY